MPIAVAALCPYMHTLQRAATQVQGEDLLLQIFTSSILQRQAGEEAPFLEFIQPLGRACPPQAVDGVGRVRVTCGESMAAEQASAGSLVS